MGRVKNTSIYLPHEIIENILSWLPVKSLLRLKVVCKQWKATISDPEFGKTHLRCFNSISSFSCLGPHHPFTRLHLENNEFRPLSASNYPPLKCSKSIIYCHCDGLYLISSKKEEQRNKYVLWNPSLGRIKELCHPYPLDRESLSIYGICYDQFVKDYKIVIGDPKHYAVFYCRNNSWSEIKETNIHGEINIPWSDGIPLNGSIYWLFFSKHRHEDRFRLVYFDGRDEKLKNANKVDGTGYKCAYLISSRDALYVFPDRDWASKEIRFMKKVGDGTWMEVKVQLPSSCHYVIPLCCTGENKIIFQVNFKFSGGINYLLYDESRTTLADIQSCSDLGFHRLFPYVENLYLL